MASRYRVKEHGTEMGGAQGEELFWTLQGRLQVRRTAGIGWVKGKMAQDKGEEAAQSI